MNEHEFPLAENDLAEIEEFPLAENDRISITLAEMENDGPMLNEGTLKPGQSRKEYKKTYRERLKLLKEKGKLPPKVSCLVADHFMKENKLLFLSLYRNKHLAVHVWTIRRDH